MNVTPSPKFASGTGVMQALKTLLSGDRSADGDEEKSLLLPTGYDTGLVFEH